MQGENGQAFSKIFDMLRFASILVLLLHFYCAAYGTLNANHFTFPFIDGILLRLWVFHGLLRAKVLSMGMGILFLIGSPGVVDEKASARPLLLVLIAGVVLYFGSVIFMDFTVVYLGITTAGYIGFLSAGLRLSRLIHLNLKNDIFNEEQETFPQEERLLQNEYSVNLPAQYKLKGKVRKSWINIINPFRALLVIGTPGSGKSYFVIRHVITQHIQKGFTFFIYDFKFPDLSVIAYNHLLRHADKYPVPPKMYFINFDDLSRTHRCNVLYPDSLLDITDATESSRTIMLALNREWIKKGGDFFVESPINFTTAIFWYLKKYQNGKYCTLPHAIELAQIHYDQLFLVLSLEPEIAVLMNPFISAYNNKAMEQLEGQIASAKIGLARLASPSLYYVLSGNDFTLDINNPLAPKIVCAGNNPAKQQIYGAVLSLYIERMLKQVNKKNQLKSHFVGDEFPTIYVGNIDTHIATARGNKAATTLGIQDFSQLRKDYGREMAEVIMNTAGNIISGQVIGETARQLSDRIGKILQDRESVSINSQDVSVSRSRQLEAAIPPAKIANLSSGEFVGAVADDPATKIKLKTFHAEILNDHTAIKKETDAYKEIPVIRSVSETDIMENYRSIKQDITGMVASQLEFIRNHPDTQPSLQKKKTNATGKNKMRSF